MIYLDVSPVTSNTGQANSPAFLLMLVPNYGISSATYWKSLIKGTD